MRLAELLEGVFGEGAAQIDDHAVAQCAGAPARTENDDLHGIPPLRGRPPAVATLKKRWVEQKRRGGSAGLSSLRFSFLDERTPTAFRPSRGRCRVPWLFLPPPGACGPPCTGGYRYGT